MADRAKKHPQNAPGRYYVDENCIGCFMCIELAADVFARVDDEEATYEAFFVEKQPLNNEDEAKCLMALDACPSNSIGSDGCDD